MKTRNLLLSSLDITEDEYYYKGSFFLSCGDTSLKVDVADLQGIAKINEIKDFFKLEESPEEVRKVLMEMVVEKAHISSKYTEGENYGDKSEENKIENAINSMNLS